MDKIKLALNLRKPGNYAFYCPVSNLHLTLSNPIGYADRVTRSILRGLKIKTILDVNEVIDIETGTFKQKQSQEIVQNVIESPKPKEIKPTEEVVVQEEKPIETPNEEPEIVVPIIEEPVQEKPKQDEMLNELESVLEEQTLTKKRGRKKKEE